MQAVDLPEELETVLLRDPDSWDDGERSSAQLQFARVAPELADARKPIDKLRNQLPAATTTMIFQERPADNPRATHRHHRGEYLQTREEVSPRRPGAVRADPGGRDGEPAQLRPLAGQRGESARRPRDGQPGVASALRTGTGRDERGLRHAGSASLAPGTARLAGRRVRQQGWSMKMLHRLIVTSATYRQSSHVTPELLQRDPQNVLFARGPRFRVDAETVRDVGLVASGLFSPKVGGPSVYPPQPASVTALAYGNTAWKPSTGEDRYRRSLYTFSKRTAPFAAYTVFDAPTGETCLARRERSNTALQALTMLNDPMFLEMAEALAAKAIESSSSPSDRAAQIVRRCLTRPPTDIELDALTSFAAEQLKRFQSGELDAGKVCTNHTASPELAAWTMVARAVLNLDETITKP